MLMTNKELIDKYPFLKLDFDPLFGGHVFEITWLDALDTGWKKAFGKEFCDELLQSLKDDNYHIATNYEDDDGFHFEEIKEKYGSLRIYYNGHPPNKYCTRDTIAKYEELSKYVCGHCGKPARYITNGWIYPLCEECIKEVYDDYIPIEKFYGFDSYDDVLKEIENIKNNFQYDRYWKKI